MLERRAYQRLPFYFPLAYRKAEGYPDGEISVSPNCGYCQNISLGGLRIETVNPLKEDSIVHLKLVLPVEDDYCRVSVDARICWLEFNTLELKYNSGIEFYNMSQVVRKVLWSFLLLKKQKVEGKKKQEEYHESTKETRKTRRGEGRKKNCNHRKYSAAKPQINS